MARIWKKDLEPNISTEYLSVKAAPLLPSFHPGPAKKERKKDVVVATLYATLK